MFRTHHYELVELSYLRTAPVIMTGSSAIRATPDVVFRCLADASSFHEWYASARSVAWSSPPPLGIGSTREMQLKNRRRLTYQVIEWQPGHRLTFSAVAGSQYGVKSYCEDFLITPNTTGGSLVTWTLAFEGRGLNKMINGLFPMVLRLMPHRRMLENRAPKLLASHLAKNSTRYGSSPTAGPMIH